MFIKKVAGKVAIIIAIPVLATAVYLGLKFGYISPMIKGLDIQIIGGTFITNVNKYVIKVGDKVNISTGDYIVVPKFAKKPDLKFIILDRTGVVSIKGNTLTANKEGYTSIGILNNNRVLRKVTIMVVNPRINNLQIALDRPLKYYSDTSEIKSSVSIDDYKKLEKGYRLSYTTDNPKVLKITGNRVEAVGIGEAKIIGRYDRKEIQRNVRILPKVVGVSLDKKIVVQEGQTISVKPSVKTLPENQVTKITYDVINPRKNNSEYDINDKTYFGDSGLTVERGIDINKDGVLTANRPGSYLVEASSEGVNAYTNVIVRERDFDKIDIENLQYRVEQSNGKYKVELGWDYNKRVNEYLVYVKKNDEKPELYTTLKTYYSKVPAGGRLMEAVEIDRPEGSDRYELYVVGKNGDKYTRESAKIDIKKDTDFSFQKKHVTDVNYDVDLENNTVRLSWKPVNNEKYTYRVYYRNNEYKEKMYKLMAKNISRNTCTLKIDKDRINYDFYIVAIDKNNQVSDLSRPVTIKAIFSD